MKVKMVSDCLHQFMLVTHSSVGELYNWNILGLEGVKVHDTLYLLPEHTHPCPSYIAGMRETDILQEKEEGLQSVVLFGVPSLARSGAEGHRGNTSSRDH